MSLLPTHRLRMDITAVGLVAVLLLLGRFSE
jgi:hypothetical protein